MPLGPPNLCAEALRKSMPSNTTGICPIACTASTWSNTPFLTKGGNGRDILNRAYLVVGVLQADQVGVGRQGAGQALRYNAAEPVNLQRCHAAAVVPD